jgi:hypothetical protein
MLIPSKHVEHYLNNEEKNICFQKEVSEKSQIKLKNTCHPKLKSVYLKA